MEMLSLFGLFVGLACFIFMSIKRFPTFLSAAVAAMVTMAFAMANPYTALTGTFMAGMSGFLKTYFLLFVVSGLFGKVMDQSYSVRRIALTLVKVTKGNELLSILVLPVFYTLMSYVGISGFVIAFTVVFIARDLLETLDLPMIFYPYGAAGGIHPGYAMAGSLAASNVAATEGFGVAMGSGVILGFVNMIVYYIVLVVLIKLDIKKYRKAGEGFLPSGAPLIAANAGKKVPTEEEMPSFIVAIIPMIVPIVCIMAFKMGAVPSLLVAILVCVLLNLKKFNNFPATLTEGLNSGVMPVVGVAAANGFATCLRGTAGFAMIHTLLSSLPGLVPPIVMMTGMCFVVGSNTSFLPAFIDIFREWMLPLGLSAEACARLIAIAGYSNMPPHNPGVINGITLSKLPFGKASLQYLKASLIPGTVSLIVCVFLASMGIC